MSEETSFTADDFTTEELSTAYSKAVAFANKFKWFDYDSMQKFIERDLRLRLCALKRSKEKT